MDVENNLALKPHIDDDGIPRVIEKTIMGNVDDDDGDGVDLVVCAIILFISKLCSNSY